MERRAVLRVKAAARCGHPHRQDETQGVDAANAPRAHLVCCDHKSPGRLAVADAAAGAVWVFPQRAVRPAEHSEAREATKKRAERGANERGSTRGEDAALLVRRPAIVSPLRERTFAGAVRVGTRREYPHRPLQRRLSPPMTEELSVNDDIGEPSAHAGEDRWARGWLQAATRAMGCPENETAVASCDGRSPS